MMTIEVILEGGKIKFSNFNIQASLALSAASGLIYEVVATNILFFYFTRSSYSISTVLSIFLFGLGLGSYIIYKIINLIGDKRLFFGILQVFIALYAFIILSNLEWLIPRISASGVFFASLIVLFLPTMFLGSIFPLSAAIFKKEKEDVTGLVYSSDLVGAILGSLAAGFWLIPIYGNRISTIIAAGINILSAIIILRGKQKLIPVGFALLMIVLLLFFPQGFWNNQSNINFRSSSPFGTVEVQNSALLIDSKWMCDYREIEEGRETTIKSEAFEFVPTKPPEVLNIGLGCGGTLQRILDATETKKIDVVEINPAVVEATKKFSKVLENPRVNLIVDDGLKYLRETDKKYDVVVIEVESPTVAHSSPLFTVEAFKLIENSLTSQGIFSLGASIPKGRYKDILAYSLKGAFGHVYNQTRIFIASNQKLPQEEYVPTSPYEINTLDRNTLTNAYSESSK